MDGLLFGSEAEGQTSFHADVEVCVEVDFFGSDCGHFTVGAETLGETHGSADFAGQFGGVVVAIGEDECRTSLDVPSSVAAELTFVTHVSFEDGGAVVATNESTVGLDVDVRTSESRSGQERGGAGKKKGFHDFS